MIPLEHRVALWGHPDYNNEFKPTPKDPIKITSTATVYDATHIGKTIEMKVERGKALIIERTFNVEEQTVFTKGEYDLSEKKIDDQINEKRTILQGIAVEEKRLEAAAAKKKLEDEAAKKTA